MGKICFIVNFEKKNKFNRFYKRNTFDYVHNIEICKKKELNNIIKKNYDKGYRIFIACGGDGTINSLLNSIISLNIKDVKLSVIPLGKANDFATNNNLSLKSILDFNKLKIKNIRPIKINDSYFITGGCFGFTTKLIEKKKNLNKKNVYKFIFNILGHKTYTILSLYYLNKFKALPKFKINNNEYEKILMTTIMNQKYIGKKYYFASNKKSNKIFEIRNLENKNSFLNRLKLMGEVMKKESKYTSYSFNKCKFSFRSNVKFMGDGEILCSGKKFNVELQDKISFLVSK